jgi:hypothetical protein
LLAIMPADADGAIGFFQDGWLQAMGCTADATPALGAHFTVRFATVDPHTAAVFNPDSGPYASATFTYLGEMRATLTLTPSVGACDTPVVAGGADFTPGTALDIYAQRVGGDQPALAARTTVATDGSFSAELDVTTMLGCRPGFNPDAAYVVWAAPDAAQPGRSAGSLFLAARDVPAAVAMRAQLLFCGADPVVERQFIDPNDAPLLCLHDAVARGGSAEFATYVITPSGETVTMYRESQEGVLVFTATRADSGLQYAWTRQICAAIHMSVQPVTVSGCGDIEQLALAR